MRKLKTPQTALAHPVNEEYFNGDTARYVTLTDYRLEDGHNPMAAIAY